MTDGNTRQDEIDALWKVVEGLQDKVDSLEREMTMMKTQVANNTRHSHHSILIGSQGDLI